MIRTTRMVTECVCKNCGIIHLLGEKFNRQRCCNQPQTVIIGKRKVVEYSRTQEEEKAEVAKIFYQMKQTKN